MISSLGVAVHASWKSVPLKHVTTFLNRGSAPAYAEDGVARAVGQAANQHGGIVWNRTRRQTCEVAPAAMRGFLRPGDVLINSTGTGTLGRIGYFDSAPDSLPCIADGHITIARASRSAVDSRYLYYWLSSTVFQGYLFQALVIGATNQIELSREGLAAAPILLPGLPEQRRIVELLDRRVCAIDDLIATRRGQLDVMAELSLGWIGSALFGGDVPGPRKSVGLGWMPSIPDSWELGPVHAYFDIQLGKMLSPSRVSGENLQPYLRNANVHWHEIVVDDLAKMVFEPWERARYGLRSGDLVVCEGGAGVAEAAVWDGSINPCYYQKSLHRARPLRDLPVEWLMYWLRYAKRAGVFHADGNFATIPHLTGEQLAVYRIPIPPDGAARVAELAMRLADVTNASARVLAANQLLTERRQALITAAVTGQIDVLTASGVAA